MLELTLGDRFPKVELKFRAAGYPVDSQLPYAGVYYQQNNLPLMEGPLGRDWHLLAFNPTTRRFIQLNSDVPSTIIAPQPGGIHFARFDTYGDPNAAQAFCLYYDAIPENHIIVAMGNHAPAHFSEQMEVRLLNMGATAALLPRPGVRPSGWSAYVCIGKKGLGTGNAFREVLNNLPDVSGQGIAETTFTF